MRKRKEKLAKLGSTPIATDNKSDNLQFLPQTRDANAGGFPEYEDVVKDLDANAYTIIRQCPAIFGPMDKIANIISRKVWKVVGNKKKKAAPKPADPAEDPAVPGVDEKLALVEPEPAEGARQQALQEIIDNMYGLKTATRAMVWGFPEGVIFAKVNVGPSIDGLEGAYVLPDLRDNVRCKANAGGRLRWYRDDATGKVYVVRVKETNVDAPVELQSEANLNPADVIIFCPGANGNPEGDPGLGISLYKIARLYNKVLKNLDRYADRHGLPLELIMGDGRPSTLGSILTVHAQKMADRKPGDTVGMNIKEKIELIEPKGTTASFLLDLKADLEADAARLILKSTLTSDTKGSGPAGSSTVHESAEEVAAQSWADQLADAFTDQLLKWIIDHNLDELPADDTTYHLELVDEEKDEEIAEDMTATVDVNGKPVAPLGQATGPNGSSQPMPMPMMENK